jgi:hypothetical protein
MQIAREVAGGGIGFEDGLLYALASALRVVADGELVALTTERDDVVSGLEDWSRLTGNAIVSSERRGSAVRLVVRKGQGAIGEDEGAAARPIGSRIWLYTNFDCNLRCDYCCVRSSPTTPRRELGLERVRRIASEARELGVEAIFVTGGEPVLLPDIGAILDACAAAAPTTLLTNGMLFTGSRAAMLDALPRDRVTLQISLDSPDPRLHDLHRGAGAWDKACCGIAVARSRGFRVRLAATVSTDAEERTLSAWLDTEGVDAEDRVVRRVALRGLATEGVALARADLAPEVTLTSSGVYWHPVGADDDDFRVSTAIFPLASAFEVVRAMHAEERAVHAAAATIFRCA